MKLQYFIIDFDSTFVTVEALDKLAAIALNKHPHREKISKKIADITKDGMEGKIEFHISLAKRLKLFQPKKEDIVQLVKFLKKHITPSIKRNKKNFQKNKDSIYIISGGFKEYILPIIKEFNILETHVLANTFKFDNKNNFIGFDKNNPLANKDGKTKAVKKLKLKGEIVMIGDGYTDYLVKKNNAAAKFYAFTENIRRQSVVKNADKIVKNFDEILSPYTSSGVFSYPKAKIKVLLLENVDQQAIDFFEKEGYPVKLLPTKLTEDELVAEISDVSLIGIRSKTQITQKVLKSAKKLLAVGVFGIGFNQVDISASSNKGIAVFNAPFSSTRSVVELVMGNIIMLYRKAFDKSMSLHNGIWDKSSADCHEVRGKKLGIIGYGNIGMQLSVLAENFGMHVYYYDLLDKPALGNAHKCDSLKELLQTADIITVHSDARRGNTHLIGAKEFAFMKHGVIFLNLSRAINVDTDSLVTNIKKGKISGAAIDVFSPEPKSSKEPFISILQGLPNVILTPHIGGSTEEAQKNIADFVANKLITFVNTGSTMLSVNFPNLILPEQKNTHRFIHTHKNSPGVLAQINNVLAKEEANIEGQYLKTNENIGYVITDIDKNYNNNLIGFLKDIPGTIKVRVLY